jgi:hypothetical protein
MEETLRHHLPAAQDSLTTVNPAKRRNQDQQWNTEGQRGPAISHARSPQTAENGFRLPSPADRWIQA